MKITQKDIEYYGLIRSKEELICEQCGKEIHPGDYTYRRYTNPVIHCVDCRKANKDRWIKNRNGSEEITKEVISILNENGKLNLSELKKKYGLNQAQIKNISKKLKDRGYIVELSKETKNKFDTDENGIWKLKYTPLIQNFLDSVMNLEDRAKIVSKYLNNAHVISSIIYEIIGKGNIIQNDESQFLRYIDNLANFSIETITNEIYVERISFDDTIYQEIIDDNRNLVMAYFIDCLFKSSKKLISNEYGFFIANGIEKSYSVITKESDIENDTGCDIDIVVTPDDIFVLINDEDGEICELLEYLDLTFDEDSINITNMMMELLEKGF